MPFADATPQEEFSLAVERMAVRALDVLNAVGGADVGLAPPGMLGASTAELAAVRILGADLFAPHLLNGVPLHPELAEAVAMAHAFQVFPPEQLTVQQLTDQEPAGTHDVQAPRTGPLATDSAAGTATVVGWRDWAASEVLSRCGLPPLVLPPLDAAPQPGRDDGEPTWQEWSLWMAKLSPLAVPGLDSPVHESARRGLPALGRGTVRAMLRRDYRTAARIARWLALGQASGLRSPLRLEPLFRHVRLFGGPSARTALDVRVGERLALAVDR
ncbi:hypothetical protein [Streptacidiphilus sp. P02-A3a]|uniref:hypothetical protein n=1 Tax=Streptacidiphilus sp. P02-A3a TaxID=2704468 RepID=UPI0015F89A55|nr:hypothetical protein [Streptacidiphilus sp. P02-A3a]QMU69548.1 hypothetical protein GXP74_16200 [Streptacidiphilus sp. P02-A3a]